MKERWEFTIVFKGRNFIVIKGTLYKCYSRNYQLLEHFWIGEKSERNFL